MEDSPTLLIQEVDVVNVIVRERRYAGNEDLLEIRLTKFEGEHFRYLTPEQTPERLYERVEEILRKFKKLDLINRSSMLDIQNISLSSTIQIDVKNRVGNLKQYGVDTEKKVVKIKGNKKVKNTNSPENLHPKILLKIPNDKRTRKVIRPMAKLIEQRGIDSPIENYLLFQCIEPNVEIYDYKKSQKKNNTKIENRFRALRRYLKPLGLTINRDFDFSILKEL